jgi:hypothetical protein
VGVVVNHPRVEAFVVQRGMNLVNSGEDFSFVLVALAGATPEEFLAHISLKFNVSVDAARDLSCIARQGGELQAQVGLQEPEPAVDSCSEVQRRDFDPMLVEVEAGLTSRAVSEVPTTVDLCFSGPDEGGLGQTSPGLLELEQVGGSPPTVLGGPIRDDATTTMHSDVVELESQIPSDGLASAVDSSAVGVPTVAGATASAATVQDELEALVCLPLQTPLIKRPRLRRSRTPVSVHSLRRSGRIAARPRVANATRQAQNVLLKKLGIAVEEDAADLEIENKVKAAFHHMSTRKQQALQILFKGDFDPAAMDLNLTGLGIDVA